MPSEIRLLSTLGVQGVMEELLPRLEELAGVRVAAASFAPTKVQMEKLAAGEPADVLILTEEAIQALSDEGRVEAGSRMDLAVSLVGLAVCAGAPRPDIGTAEALRRTLLGAGSLVYSRAGASGIFFAGLLERLGIAAEVNAKATIIPSGLTGEPVARGEAELAIQQMSELMLVPGLDIVGALPMELQEPLVFSAAIMRGAAPPAADFLKALGAAFTPELLRRKGLSPT
jgi:molybdate transport system substrate-binding protein